MSDGEYITRSELARMLCVSHSTLKKWVAKGKFPKPEVIRGRPSFKLADISHIIEPIIAQRYMLNP